MQRVIKNIHIQYSECDEPNCFIANVNDSTMNQFDTLF